MGGGAGDAKGSGSGGGGAGVRWWYGFKDALNKKERSRIRVGRAGRQAWRDLSWGEMLGDRKLSL